MKTIHIQTTGGNFTPAGLMQRYAQQTAGAAFNRSLWGEAVLNIDGAAYKYHHWSITANERGELVTVYLTEIDPLKIYFFEADPETGIIKAGYTIGGKRYVSIVCSQGARLYVRTGATISGDLKLHHFNEKQTAAFNAFLGAPCWSVEYREGIA